MRRNPEPTVGQAAGGGQAPQSATRLRRRLLAGTTALGAVALVATAFATSSSASAPVVHVAQAAPKGLYGALPAVGKPTKGGTITFAQQTGSTPTDIFPIIPDADASVFTANEFIDQMWLPLYNGPVGATQKLSPQLSLASLPVFTDGNKTVTIHMDQGYRWSNGQPVDANDVLFYIALVKQAVKISPANWSDYTPGLLPDSLASISAPSKYTVVMHLKKAFNPGYFLNDQLNELWPIPSEAWNVASPGGPHLNWQVPANAKKIYDYFSKAGAELSSFGTNPLWKIADGPFEISSFNTTNSSYVLNANPDFGGTPKPSIAHWSVETFTGITPELNALKTGTIDIGGVDFSQLGQVSSLTSGGYSVFGYPGLGWYGAFYNFKDTTGHFNKIISQLYIREAFSELENEPAILTGIYKNAGGLAYGPVPSIPPTAYTPPDAINPPYPYNPTKAVALLKAHGWKVVPNGQTTCAKAGTGAGECGAGIPVGTPIKFTWFYLPTTQTPSSSLESEAFASEAKEAAGINVILGSKTFNFLTSTYSDAIPSDAKYDNAWGVNNFGGFTEDYYPTQDTIFNTGGDYNWGDYSNPTADALINNSVFGSNPKAVTNEASYLTKNPPIMFFPNADLIWAVSNKVGGTANSFIALTQNYASEPQFYYLNK
jgi:peptide/nickel transport system substrate-binding protein